MAELTASASPALEAAGRQLVVRAQLAAELRASDSIAVSGVCLTVLASDTDSFRCDLSPETLQRTNLGALAPGALVNLERQGRRTNFGASSGRGAVSQGAISRLTLTRPSSRPGTTISDGRFWLGSARNAAAITSALRSPSPGNMRRSPSSWARETRMNCSIRGFVRGTTSARLSSERISQKVL